MYIRDEEDSFIRLVLFFASSVASFCTGDVLMYFAGVGVCYWILGIVSACIRVAAGLPFIAQVNDLVEEKPYMPLQVFHILYGIVLGFLTHTLPMREYVIDGEVVSTHLFFFVSLGYILWGTTRLLHDWEYYREFHQKDCRYCELLP